MREAKRIYAINPRGVLKRGADGQLKPADKEQEIADIWAEQKRIRLREAIEEDKRKAEKKARRREWRRGLLNPRKKAVAAAVKPRTVAPSAGAAEAAKAIEIKISMPSLPKVKAPNIPWAKFKKQLAKVSVKTWVIAGAAAFVLLVLPVIIQFSTNHHAPAKTVSKKTSTKVSGSSNAVTGPVKGTPTYPTILPAGKTADKLGGWARVSPAGADPVYAYADTVAGVIVDVSEQPLPATFRADTTGQVEKLAQGFNATQKLTAGTTTAYLGTSAKGPQSVIFTEKGLLILMKSASQLTTDQWVAYISSLR